MSVTKVDVLVVGAGPAGLVCANALAKGGVKVKVVDIKPVRVRTGQADGLMPRTMEVLQSYGLAEPILKQAAQIHSVAFYNHTEGTGITLADHKPPVMEETARYQFLTTLSQAGIEGVLLDSMGTVGVTVDRPVKPKSITITESEVSDANAHPVKVVLSLLDADGKEVGTEDVHAKYVVGTDGAHSWVRSAVGIQMIGDSTDHAWGAIDFVPNPNSNFPDWRNCCNITAKDAGIVLIPREDDMVRLYVDLGSEADLVDKATGRLKAGHVVTAETLLDVAKKAFEPFEFTSTVDRVDWWTLYIIGQRVADTLSVQDRVFIAGDAAHTHSPKAGQGMNVSMNDAHNLAWKLVYAIRGWARPELLATYNFERLKFAQELIAFDKWYSQGFSAKARQDLFGDSHAPSPFEAFIEMSSLTSGIGIQYSPSVITAPIPTPSPSTHLTSSLTIGKRLPPHQLLRLADRNLVELQDLCPSDTKFKVLVFAGDVSTGKEKLATFAETLSGTLAAYPKGAFDVLTIVKGDKDALGYLDVPASLRSTWEKVLIDDTHRHYVTHKFSGRIYEAYGIDASGAVVVVRPDGYVGATFALGDVSPGLEQYLSAFLTPI